MLLKARTRSVTLSRLFVRTIRRAILRCRGERCCPFTLLSLPDAANGFHEIRIVYRLLSVPGDVAIHGGIGAITIHRCRIARDVERQHRQEGSWNRERAQSNSALVDSPFIAALLDRPISRIASGRHRSNG